MEKARTVLVAEDDHSDAVLLELAFKKAGMQVDLRFVRDGQEVIDYLSGQGKFQEPAMNSMPVLLLLDLKMPRMNGFDVLRWVRQQPGLKRLVVIIFSSSDLGADINQAYDLGANSYVVKPGDFGELSEVARNLEKYWMEVNCAPAVP
jgi:CheY-like chemotaxis protein